MAWRWVAGVAAVCAALAVGFSWSAGSAAESDAPPAWWPGSASFGPPCDGRQDLLGAIREVLQTKSTRSGAICYHKEKVKTDFRYASSEFDWRLHVGITVRNETPGQMEINVTSGSLTNSPWRWLDGAGRGSNELSCADARGITFDLASYYGLIRPHTVTCTPMAFQPDPRKPYWKFRGINIKALYAPNAPPPTAAPKPALKCSAAAVSGVWLSDAPKHAGKGVSLKIAPQPNVKSWILGDFGVRGPIEQLDAGLTPSRGIWGSADPKAVGDACVFRIKVSPGATDTGWYLRYSPATDSLHFAIDEAGRADARLPGRWRRGSAAPAETKPVQACSKTDVNGTWHRTDGARIAMSGVGTFAGGGSAIMDRYPEDRWPRGEMKFREVKEAGSCRYSAQCISVKSTTRLSDGRYNFQTLTSSCTLVVDPNRRTLTASGSHGFYTRTAPAASAAPAPPLRPPEPDRAAEAAREAAKAEAETTELNRKVAEKNAEIDRRNAEARAADGRRKAEYEAALARREAEVARIARESAEAQARHEREMAAWRARVAACKAGDVAQCSP